jgi:hypothetical protein
MQATSELVATSLDSSVRVQDLSVPTLARCSHSIGVPRNRCGIYREEAQSTDVITARESSELGDLDTVPVPWSRHTQKR